MHACACFRIRCRAAAELEVEVWLSGNRLGVGLGQCKKRGHLSHLMDHQVSAVFHALTNNALVHARSVLRGL